MHIGSSYAEARPKSHLFREHSPASLATEASTSTSSSNTASDSLVDPVPDRRSSETTILTILSMYGDEHANATQAAAVTLPVRRRSTPKLSGNDLRQSATLRAPVVKVLELDQLSQACEEIPSNHTSITSSHTSAESYNLRSSLHATNTAPSPPLVSSPRYSRASPSPRQSQIATSPKNSPKLTPQLSPLLGPVDVTGSSGSKVSLVPSEGEEPDSFYVRSTYAQLDVYGVKGDGVEEGVERTRARVGNTRSSQLQAASAVADSTEKTRDLTPLEIQTLRSLDRYGFFSTPSHDRLVLVPSAPLQRRLSALPAGPSTAPPNATSLSSLPPLKLSGKESTRIEKWSRMLVPDRRDEGGNIDSWSIRPSKERKLRSRTYKGIPDRWRSAVWWLFIERYAKGSHMEAVELGKEYRARLEQPSQYDIQIDLDVPRTISGHILFRTRYGIGQRSLFHVLHSFSLKCDVCGYVQGMGPIAATLLCYMDIEHVYACLIRLHDAYSLHTIFSPGFPGLLEAIYLQERIMEQMLPGVYAAFKKHMISTTSYATKWYITLFANSVPFQTQLRLWDAFFLDGPDVFIAMAVAIVWSYRDHITSGSASFETVLSLLSSFFVPENEDVLLFWIEKLLADHKLRAQMSQWRQHWKSLCAKGEEGSALL